MRSSAFLIAAFLLFTPVFVTAQDAGLVPTCDTAGTGGTYDCQLADFITLINNVLNFIITLSVFIAILLIVYAGFLLLTDRGNQSNRTKAVNTIWAAVIGLIIVLAAWLIVNTVLMMLTGDGLRYWANIRRASLPEVRVTAGQQIAFDLDGDGVTETIMTDGGAGGGVLVDGVRMTDTEARQLLTEAGISIWESAPGRTTFTNINGNVIQEVLRLQQSCNCSVTVTGGTESGHEQGPYSHSAGYKVDIDDSSGVNTYVTQNGTFNGYRRGNEAIYCIGGNEYVRESNHWDITVGGQNSCNR